MLRLLLLLLVVLTPSHCVASVILASGAGYRAMVDELVQAYNLGHRDKVERIYGNMGRVIGQAKMGGGADLVLGAAYFFDKAQLDLDRVMQLGRGQLVLAYAKKIELKKPEDLSAARVQRIAHPDSTRAVYGKASMEYLHRSGLFFALEEKLIGVATVPQAASYVVTGEVDAAFINSIHAAKIKESIGGIIRLNPQQYEPIDIIVASLKSSEHRREVESFLHYLGSDDARLIIHKHGL